MKSKSFLGLSAILLTSVLVNVSTIRRNSFLSERVDSLAIEKETLSKKEEVQRNTVRHYQGILTSYVERFGVQTFYDYFNSLLGEVPVHECPARNDFEEGPKI